MTVTLLDSNRDPTDLAAFPEAGKSHQRGLFFQNVVAVNPDVGQFVACVLEYFVLDN